MVTAARITFAACAVVAAVGSPAVRAQSGSQQSDSLRHYELAEIVIGGSGERPSEASVVRRVHLAEIVRLAAPDVASVARLIPSAHVQTNSRGETLVYVRGSGERQVATFLDGALLNVPWDNRVDLGLVPASILGGVGVVNGTASVLYGTNTLGGAVLLSTRSLERSGELSEVGVVVGTQGTRRVDGMHLVRRGGRSLLLAGGWSATDGFRAPSGASLPADGVRDGLRTNTDRRLAHLFARGSLQNGMGQVGLSLLHVDSEQGVAPEGHLDPNLDPVRYWRYPLWRLTQVTLNGLWTPGSGWTGRATAWVSRFRQRIDQFGASDYRDVAGREDDEDLTFGIRMLAGRTVGAGTVRIVLNALSSTHDQVDVAADDAGRLVGSPEVRYGSRIASAGIEYAARVTERLDVTGGVSLDAMSTPETGDKPARDALHAWGASLVGRFELARGAVIDVAAGRKVRFPTPRELFGTALNRFLVNDGLLPETGWSAELGASRPVVAGATRIAVFVRRTFDTIDQETVSVDERRLRRRINLDGSRTAGIEWTGQIEPDAGFEVEWILTVMDSRVLGHPVRTRLTEKPDVLGTITTTWTARWGGAATLQATYTGRAWGLGPQDEFVALPRAVVVNARLAWRRYMGRAGIFTELFVRGDNLFDTVMLPQPGLPAPGRSLRLGLSVSF